MSHRTITVVVNGVPKQYVCDDHTTGRKIANAFAGRTPMRAAWELLDGSGAPVPDLDPLDIDRIAQPLYYQPTPGAGG